MYFLPENMSFLRIVQIIDIKAKKFVVLEYSSRPSKNRQNSKRTSFFRFPGQLGKRTHETVSDLLDSDKKHMFCRDVATGIAAGKEVRNKSQIEKQTKLYII